MLRVGIIFSLLAFSACSVGYKPQLYDWDAYNAVMDSEVAEAEGFQRLEMVRAFQDEINKLPTNSIPPGALLHLAFLCEQEGLTDEARISMQREKELYPDSAQWIDFILKQEKSGKAGNKR